MAGAERSPASAKRDVMTGKQGALKVYNEAELGVQRLRIPGELKDGGEATARPYSLYVGAALPPLTESDRRCY